MMKKILLASILSGLLIACETSPKHDEGEGGGYSPVANATHSSGGYENAGAAPSSGGASSAPKGAAAVTSGPVVGQGALADAIKAQNDEQIFRVSGQLLTQNPNDVRALNAMAMYYFRKGKVDAAKFLLSKALAANPNAGEVYSNMGLVHMAQNEHREAIRAFRKALDINSRDGIAAANAGSIYAAEKDYGKAVSALQVAYNAGVRDAKIMNNYAVALTGVGKFDEANSIYKAALKDQNNNRELLLNYAILLIDHMNKHKEGMDTLNRLKFVGPPSESRNRIIALENKAKAGLK